MVVSGRSGFTRGFVIFLVAAVIILVGALWLNVANADTEADIDSTTIASSFEDVAELATQKYEFTDVGKRTEDSKDLFGFKVPPNG